MRIAKLVLFCCIATFCVGNAAASVDPGLTGGYGGTYTAPPLFVPPPLQWPVPTTERKVDRIAPVAVQYIDPRIFFDGTDIQLWPEEFLQGPELLPSKVVFAPPLGPEQCRMYILAGLPCAAAQHSK